MNQSQIEKIKKQIEKEIGGKIEIIRSWEMFFVFRDETGRVFTNNLTKTKRHQKNSIRIFPQY